MNNNFHRAWWLVTLSALVAMSADAVTEKLKRTAFLNSLAERHKTSPRLQETPIVSIITSLYKGDDFIEGFLKDIVRQTIFDQCELIIINAKSPGNEEPIILEYCKAYPNIIYIRLDYDPGLYAVWNMAIKMARGRYITNSNVDDRRNPQNIEMYLRVLEAHPAIDLVYSNFYLTRRANTLFEEHSHCSLFDTKQYRTPKSLCEATVGPQPMWRKCLHDQVGYFDESFTSSGDWEFWNRLASSGCRLSKIHGISGVYYENPQGISTNSIPANVIKRMREDQRIRELYPYLSK